MSKVKQGIKAGIKALEADVASWLPRAAEFPKVGQRVRLKPSHPHGDQTGVVVRFEAVKLFPEEGERPVVQLDSGHEVFITHPRDWEAA